MDIKPVRCRIPEILRRKRKTQVWLAEQVGISRQLLNDYIHLRIMMGIIIAAKIARVLDVNIDDLYEWEWLGE
jgi:DNA-binding XRE family transcriptional regulator